MILDIHTHKPAPYPEGIVNLPLHAVSLLADQSYSCGIHPWDSNQGNSTEDLFALLRERAADRRVVAIGECGVDLIKGGPLFQQLNIFRKQIELSEELCKPLIIHCVKATDIMLGLKRDIRPQQPWIIHGFRGKPESAKQLTDKGFYLSFGEKFNAETVAMMPSELLLAETDESILSITEIIGQLSVAANRDVTSDIITNTATILQR